MFAIMTVRLLPMNESRRTSVSFEPRNGTCPAPKCMARYQMALDVMFGLEVTDWALGDVAARVSDSGGSLMGTVSSGGAGLNDQSE